MEMTVGTDQSEINELFGISFRYHNLPIIAQQD